jgi:hypothetical protein
MAIPPSNKAYMPSVLPDWNQYNHLALTINAPEIFGFENANKS